MQIKLTLKPIARSPMGVEYGTGSVMQYEVEGLPGGQRFRFEMSVLRVNNPFGKLALTSGDARPDGRAPSNRLTKPSLNCKSSSTLRMKKWLNDDSRIPENRRGWV